MDIYAEIYVPTETEIVERTEEEEDEILLHLYKKRRVEPKNELESYLSGDVAHYKTDVLQWWRVNISPSQLKLFR